MKTLKLSMISAAVIAAMRISSAFTDLAQSNSGSTVTVASSMPVTDKCTTLTGGIITFAAYVPDATATNDTATPVSVRCTKGTPVSISMDQGEGDGANEGTRLLSSDDTTDTLEYDLYQNSARSILWGTGTDVKLFSGDGLPSRPHFSQVLDATHTLSVTGKGLGNSVSATSYSKIPKNQLDVVTGSYSDSITVTVTY